MSWRRKLEGFQLGAPSATSRVDSNPSDGNPNNTDDFPPWLVQSEATKDWNKPGIYGIQRDEGLSAPDLHDPDLLRVCDMYGTNSSRHQDTEANIEQLVRTVLGCFVRSGRAASLPEKRS